MYTLKLPCVCVCVCRHVYATKVFRDSVSIGLVVAHRKSSLWIDIYHAFNEFLGSRRNIGGDIEPTSLDLFQKNPKIVIVKWK